MLPALKNLPYSKRIKACTGNLSTLHYTCIRGDMVEAYKIITGKYDPLVSPNIRQSVCMPQAEMIYEATKKSEQI